MCSSDLFPSHDMVGGSGLWVMADERSGLQRNEEASEECLVRVEAVAGWGCGAVFCDIVTGFGGP